MKTPHLLGAYALLVLTSRITFAADAAPAGDLEKQLTGWPERPRLQARIMMGKYGPPQTATADKLTWMDAGPYKRIAITKHEDHHDFPLPHTDFLQHTVSFKVPADKADELTKYDGSCTFDRTQGELSARCDLEGHNILTLNLAHDIISGKLSAEAARKKFGETVVADLKGEHPAYVEALQFEPAKDDAKFSDKPTIPGAPKRPGEKATAGNSGGDGEVLGMIAAVNMNEIIAAMVASKKKVSPEVLEFAKLMHTEHGRNMEMTIKVGEKIDVTPLETDEVDALKKKDAGALAGIVPLEGEAFGKAYIDMMVKGHAEVLEAIDGKLLPAAQNEAVKKHLTETREHVAMHLEKAKELQGKPSSATTGSQDR